MGISKQIEFLWFHESSRVVSLIYYCFYNGVLNDLPLWEQQVVQLLKGEKVPNELNQNSSAPRSLLIDACDLEDYTCSNYLNDLNRHKQLLMEWCIVGAMCWKLHFGVACYVSVSIETYGKIILVAVCFSVCTTHVGMILRHGKIS